MNSLLTTTVLVGLVNLPNFAQPVTATKKFPVIIRMHHSSTALLIERKIRLKQLDYQVSIDRMSSLNNNTPPPLKSAMKKPSAPSVVVPRFPPPASVTIAVAASSTPLKPPVAAPKPSSVVQPRMKLPYTYLEASSDWLCCRCHNVPDDSPSYHGDCGQLLCKNCYFPQPLEHTCKSPAGNWYPLASNKILSSIYQTLKVKCNNKGCDKVSVRAEMLKHDCEFKQILCDDCKTVIYLKEMKQHQSSCPQRIITCNYCHKPGPAVEIEKHEFRDIECKLCKHMMKEKETKQHQEVCPQRIVTCNYCNKTGPAVEIEKHEFLDVKCELCNIDVKEKELKQHKETCPQRPLNCDYCGTTAAAVEIKEHESDISKCQNICKLTKFLSHPKIQDLLKGKMMEVVNAQPKSMMFEAYEKHMDNTVQLLEAFDKRMDLQEEKLEQSLKRKHEEEKEEKEDSRYLTLKQIKKFVLKQTDLEGLRVGILLKRIEDGLKKLIANPFETVESRPDLKYVLEKYTPFIAVGPTIRRKQHKNSNNNNNNNVPMEETEDEEQTDQEEEEEKTQNKRRKIVEIPSDDDGFRY